MRPKWRNPAPGPESSASELALGAVGAIEDGLREWLVCEIEAPTLEGIDPRTGTLDAGQLVDVELRQVRVVHVKGFGSGCPELNRTFV